MTETKVEDKRSTAAESVRSYPLEGPQTASPLVREYGLLRDSVSVLRSDVEELEADLEQEHHEQLTNDLRQRAKVKEKKSSADLLEELATDRGLSWTAIARAAGVSVAAVRKWRHAGATSPEKRAALAEFASFLDILEESQVNEPGSWLELPVSSQATVTHMDVYSAGRADLLLDLPSQRKNEQQVLDAFDPDWRQRYGRDFEVFTGPDGLASIRRT